MVHVINMYLCIFHFCSVNYLDKRSYVFLSVLNIELLTFHMRKCNSVTTTCEEKKNVGQISIQNKGDMMKIEMKHHPGDSYCVVEFRGTIPN